MAQPRPGNLITGMNRPIAGLSITKRLAGGRDEQDISFRGDLLHECACRMRRIFVHARILESNACCEWIVEYDVYAAGGAGYDSTKHGLDRELQPKWQ